MIGRPSIHINTYEILCLLGLFILKIIFDNSFFLKLYISVGAIFNFMLGQCCANALVRPRHKNHLVRAPKRSHFGLKTLLVTIFL